MRRTIVVLAVLATGALGGCGADAEAPPPIEEQTGANDQEEPDNGQDGPDDGPEQGDASLAHTLRFSSSGPTGHYRLTLEPDGAAEGQRNIGDPFDVDVDELAAIAAAVDEADLANQPAKIADSDQVTTDGEEYEFEYGEARVRYVSGPIPDELVELAELLRDLVRSNLPES